MEIYYIYEIKGVKIGCTKDIERRQREQLKKGKMVLLETHSCIDKATKRETELQVERGYKVTGNYKASRKANKVSTKPVYQKKRITNTDYTKRKQAINARKFKAYIKNNLLGIFTAKQITNIYNVPYATIYAIAKPHYPDKAYKGYTFKYA